MDNQNNSLDSNFAENELKMLCYNCFEVLITKLSKKSDEVPFPINFKNVEYTKTNKN